MRLLALFLVCLSAYAQLPKTSVGGTTTGSGSGDVTAASSIGKGQIAIGSDGAKAIEPSTLDAAVVKATKGVPSAAAASDVSSLYSGGGTYLCADGTKCAGDGTGTDDQTAAEVANTPAGDIEAVTVQAAINELDTEKSGTAHTHSYLPLAGGTMTGDLDLAARYIGFGTDPADAGAQRFANNLNLCWESNPTGTDLCLYVGTDNEFHITAPLNIGGTGGPILLTEADVTEPAGAGTARLGIETDHLIHVFANGQADKIVAYTDSNITGTANGVAEAYDATNWDSDSGAATKNDLRDKFETMPVNIASGDIALATTEIASGACSSAQTDSATGVATTDTIIWTPNADITAVTGYAPSTNGGLAIYPYPTANNVNFKVCNPTASAITPGAVTLNWKVIR